MTGEKVFGALGRDWEEIKEKKDVDGRVEARP
jgi:hypothetical protein